MRVDRVSKLSFSCQTRKMLDWEAGNFTIVSLILSAVLRGDGSKSSNKTSEKTKRKPSPTERSEKSHEYPSCVPAIKKIHAPQMMPGEANDRRQMLLKKAICLSTLL